MRNLILTDAYTCTRVYMHIFKLSHIQAPSGTNIHICPCTYSLAHKQTLMYTYIHIGIDTYILILTDHT